MVKQINVKNTIDYTLELEIKQLLAQQNMEFDKRVPIEKLGFSKRQTTTYTEQAQEPETKDNKTKHAPEKRTRKKKRKDVTDMLCHCFQRNNGNIVAPLGGTFGHLKTVARKAATNIGLAKYKQPAIELISFTPKLIDLGKDKNITYTQVLEPRSRGKTRELVLYETIKDRKCKITMQVSVTCPLTGDELSSLITAIKDYDGFGPSRRGQIQNITLNKNN